MHVSYWIAVLKQARPLFSAALSCLLYPIMNNLFNSVVHLEALKNDQRCFFFRKAAMVLQSSKTAFNTMAQSYSKNSCKRRKQMQKECLLADVHIDAYNTPLLASRLALLQSIGIAAPQIPVCLNQNGYALLTLRQAVQAPTSTSCSRSPPLQYSMTR